MSDMIMRGKHDAKVVTDFGFVPKHDDLISRSAALNALLMSKNYWDARDSLEQLPAVEAIPVEWLNQKYAENEPGDDKDCDYFLWDAIAYILPEWKKEQEART